MIRFIATAQKNIISVLGEKKTLLDTARKRLEHYARTQGITELQRNMLYFLLQEELFDDAPKPISLPPNARMAWRGGAEDQHRARGTGEQEPARVPRLPPIRYSLTATARAEFLQ